MLWTTYDYVPTCPSGPPFLGIWVDKAELPIFAYNYPLFFRLDSAEYLWDSVLTSTYSQCKYLNISVCDISGTPETQIPREEFRIFVYNPLGQSAEPMIRFPIKGNQWEVEAENGLLLASQILKIPETVIKIPGRQGQTDIDHEIVFNYKIPAIREVTKLGKQSVKIQVVNWDVENLWDIVGQLG